MSVKKKKKKKKKKIIFFFRFFFSKTFLIEIKFHLQYTLCHMIQLQEDQQVHKVLQDHPKGQRKEGSQREKRN
jgi:hypothetical protein